MARFEPVLMRGIGERDLTDIETYKQLGGFGALLVLAFVFASFLAIVPIMMAIVSILTTFLVVWGLTTVTEVSPIV